MKLFYLLFILICPFNVMALDVDTFCSNEYLNPYIELVNTIINLIKIAVPVLLVVLGMLDLGKAVASQKEDKIKAGQKNLISRLITGFIVYFVVAIVQLLVGIIESAVGSTSIWSCICKFVGSCK